MEVTLQMNTSSMSSAHGAGVEGIRRLPITIALVIGAFVSILNETLLNVAYTDLMQELRVGPSTYNGFLLLIC